MRLQQGAQRALHHQALALAGTRGHADIDLGQHPRDFVAREGWQGRGGCGVRSRHHRAQQTCERGEGHAGIAGPVGRTHHAGVAVGKGLQQPRLAQARLADQRDHLATAPGRVERRQFVVAANQPGRAQHTRGHRPVARCHAGLSNRLHRRQQGQRLRGRACADLVCQHLLAAVEGEQCRGAVARQVVQADHAAVRVFGQGLQREQFLRMRERIGMVLHAFGHLAQFDQALADAGTAPVALLREPEAERTADLVAAGAEHAIGIVQVMAHA